MSWKWGSGIYVAAPWVFPVNHLHYWITEVNAFGFGLRELKSTFICPLSNFIQTLLQLVFDCVDVFFFIKKSSTSFFFIKKSSTSFDTGSEAFYNVIHLYIEKCQSVSFFVELSSLECSCQKVSLIHVLKLLSIRNLSMNISSLPFKLSSFRSLIIPYLQVVSYFFLNQRKWLTSVIFS